MSEEAIKSSGTCLCGKVSYEATLKSGTGACHCAMCRRWSAGPFMAAHAIGPVSFSGNEHIRVYKSSAWAERGFCKQCGSNLYYRLLPRPEFPDGEFILSSGTVTDQSQLKFDHEVFIDHAPGWYAFADKAVRKQMTEAELMAQFESAD